MGLALATLAYLTYLTRLPIQAPGPPISDRDE